MEEGPTQHMPPPPSSPPPGYGSGMMGWQGARAPVPGNAEWLLWLAVEILFAIIWAASPSVNGVIFMAMTAIVTLGYLISRGIAKAGKVLEQ
ncbi:MAG TPA: hypothetical protein VFB42_12505 [Gaiellaceae bacterium]|nr:hypothetical protein [Gaiellaceae bacterium]